MKKKCIQFQKYLETLEKYPIKLEEEINEGHCFLITNDKKTAKKFGFRLEKNNDCE